MPIKPTRLSQLVSGVLMAVAACSVYAAPPGESASPYKLNLAPPQNIAPAPNIESAQIPQAGDLNTNGTVPADPQAYQLEYKYRSQTVAPNKSKAALPPTASADKATPGKASSTTAKQQAIPGKFTPETLANEKLENQPFSAEIALAARAAGLDPALVHAIIYVESHYRHSAISPKGAIGLMQLMPGTSARYGIIDPSKSRKANLKAGTLYLRDLMRQFDNRIDLVLAAYNAGEGAVLKNAMQVPPYRETRLYVRAVIAKYNEWRIDKASDEIAADGISTNADLQPAARPNPAKIEYLAGTRLTSPDPQFAPNY